MHLNHPEAIPSTPVCGKIVFHETSSWCQKSWTAAVGGWIRRRLPLLQCLWGVLPGHWKQAALLPISIGHVCAVAACSIVHSAPWTWTREGLWARSEGKVLTLQGPKIAIKSFYIFSNRPHHDSKCLFCISYMPGTLSTLPRLSHWNPLQDMKWQGTVVMPIQVRKLRLWEERLIFGPESFNSKVKCRSVWPVNL